MNKNRQIIKGSCSTGRVVPKHNFRDEQIPDNVDKDRIKDNVILIDNLHGRTIEEFTNDEMKIYIKEHNKKQKRKDRRISTDYTKWHLNNKLLTKNAKTKEDVKFAYEFVLCYGNNEDLWKEYFNPETPEERRNELYNEAIEFYTDTVKDIQDKYKHLRIAYAVIHADEPNGSIHCHLCVQPRAEYNEKMQCKVCIGRALSQDGIERLENRMDAETEGFQLTRLYGEIRREIMNPKLKRLGYEIGEEIHGLEHIPSNIFTEKMNELKQTEQEVTRKEQEAIRRIEAINLYKEEMEEIEHIRKLPSYDTSKIEKHTKGIVNKTEYITTTKENWESAKSSTDIKNLSRQMEEKAKAEEKTRKKLIESLRTKEDIQLKQENEKLRKENEELTYETRTLKQDLEKVNKKVSRLSYNIELIKNFIKNLGLSQRLNNYLRQFQDPEIERSR